MGRGPQKKERLGFMSQGGRLRLGDYQGAAAEKERSVGHKKAGAQQRQPDLRGRDIREVPEKDSCKLKLTHVVDCFRGNVGQTARVFGDVGSTKLGAENRRTVFTNRTERGKQENSNTVGDGERGANGRPQNTMVGTWVPGGWFFGADCL